MEKVQNARLARGIDERSIALTAYTEPVVEVDFDSLTKLSTPESNPAEGGAGFSNTTVVGRRNDGSTVLFGELVGLAERALQAGVRFGQWAAQMIRQLGAAVRQYLRGAWDAARKGSERGALDIGGSVRSMASESGAAQNAEPSTGGLTESERAQIISNLPPIPKGRYALVKTGLFSKLKTQVFEHPEGGLIAIVPASAVKWGSWQRTKFRAFADAAWPFDQDVFIRTHNNAKDFEYIKKGTHKGSKNHATGEDEGGLSVARNPETPAKYAY
jgi:hypothetical protein